jgi:hypothetical protein
MKFSRCTQVIVLVLALMPVSGSGKPLCLSDDELMRVLVPASLGSVGVTVGNV